MEGKSSSPPSSSSTEKNWSEKVEDLIESGQINTAICLLETLIPNFETLNSNSQLASALVELSKLYSSKGLSLKSDHLSSRAAAIKLSSLSSTVVSHQDGDSRVSSSIRDKEIVQSVAQSSNDNVAGQASSDDDWEAMVDRAPDELLSVSPPSVPVPEVSKLSLSKMEVKTPNRRGRGTFSYRKQGLYSDQQGHEDVGYESPDEQVHHKPEKVSETRNSVYGTHHVLVLDGFLPSTKTIDLEKLFEDFKDRGFSIRWVHDTLALAVFRTPSIAREALNSVSCSYSVRVLEEDDSIMSSVSVKDLDPPRQRPKTSARTAQRLIAQELGVKLPSNFGSRELRKQEDSRKSRIVARQNLRDEAWGPDDS